ncbi:NAD(P)H-quinone dehydrogenase [Parenemella sanctibonifatiensis]|uniref:NAD(P)H-quinone dehydrogenase n=1 Tax=Parenemella sanctibonifatiensis TaxID=2016505 RepID=A0A255EMJ4_9ACTN|nr:NAD(P)H-quinone dehydrogenase [Parenemella sanctibonifatiensis]OYN92201.1 NAD(P)H-quinone dehydrogenase [Parenemella sanctibonifatiensis]
MTSVVIVGGGPGGYEAALTAAQLGAEVTLVEADALGGAAVLTDCVPSKTLIATAEVLNTMANSLELGLSVAETGDDNTVMSSVRVDLAAVNRRVKHLAQQQSEDITRTLRSAGVHLVQGTGRLAGAGQVLVQQGDGQEQTLEADVVLLAVGTHPRELPEAMPDGERILNWKQLYDLDKLPERLIVVGSGVTGVEFAGAYDALGSDVVLVSSRDLVLPGEDHDAGQVLQDVFERGGMTVMSRSRAQSARRTEDGVTLTLTDGREVSGSHLLLAVGSIPNTEGVGLQDSGIALDERGFITVDRVSRTSLRGVYAAGDCTGVHALASVAAMQGRIAMFHALGDAVEPLDLTKVASNVFTAPEIATVGVTQDDVDNGRTRAIGVKLPLRSNARAKMQSITAGFVKVFCLPTTGIIVGGVVVAPHASELIHPLSLAVAERITVESFAKDFTVYPSLSGSLAEAARLLRDHAETKLH